MEGSWHLYRPDTRWRRPTHEARVVLRTQDWTAVGFALGVVEVVARDAEDTVVGHLGPDLLGPGWDEDEALRRLLADPARPVAEALLDQRNLAGIGNLYKNEMCFLAGVHPRLPVGEVADPARLVRRALPRWRRTRRVQQTFTGDLRRVRRPGSTAATAGPAVAAARGSGWRCRDPSCRSGRRTGAPPASRGG